MSSVGVSAASVSGTSGEAYGAGSGNELGSAKKVMTRKIWNGSLNNKKIMHYFEIEHWVSLKIMVMKAKLGKIHHMFCSG